MCKFKHQPISILFTEHSVSVVLIKTTRQLLSQLRRSEEERKKVKEKEKKITTKAKEKAKEVRQMAERVIITCLNDDDLLRRGDLGKKIELVERHEPTKDVFDTGGDTVTFWCLASVEKAEDGLGQQLLERYKVEKKPLDGHVHAFRLPREEFERFREFARANLESREGICFFVSGGHVRSALESNLRESNLRRWAKFRKDEGAYLVFVEDPVWEDLKDGYSETTRQVVDVKSGKSDQLAKIKFSEKAQFLRTHYVGAAACITSLEKKLEQFCSDNVAGLVVVGIPPRAYAEMREKYETISTVSGHRIKVENVLTGTSEGIVRAREKILGINQDPRFRDDDVKILGPPGSGKELVAQLLHETSSRWNGPFVAVNVAALPPTLAADLLFGHDKGAFTGADTARKGLIEEAAGGSIFLDEVADAPGEVLASLLRFLDPKVREIQRLGASSPIKVDVRVFLATNFLRMSPEARQRYRDVFDRVALEIHTPALRDNREDIIFHAERMWRVQLEGSAPPAEVLSWLAKQKWTGNVRELEGFLKNVRCHAVSGELTVDLLERVASEVGSWDADGGEFYSSGSPVDQHRRYRALESIAAAIAALLAARGIFAFAIPDIVDKIRSERATAFGPAGSLGHGSSVRVCIFERRQLGATKELVEEIFPASSSPSNQSRVAKPEIDSGRIVLHGRVTPATVNMFRESIGYPLADEARSEEVTIVLDDVTGELLRRAGWPAEVPPETSRQHFDNLVKQADAFAGHASLMQKRLTAVLGQARLDDQPIQNLERLRDRLHQRVARGGEDEASRLRLARLCAVLDDWCAVSLLLGGGEKATSGASASLIGAAFCRSNEAESQEFEQGLALLGRCAKGARSDQATVVWYAAALSRSGQPEQAVEILEGLIQPGGGEPFLVLELMEAVAAAAKGTAHKLAKRHKGYLSEAIECVREQEAMGVRPHTCELDRALLCLIDGDQAEAVAALLSGIDRVDHSRRLTDTLTRLERIAPLATTEAVELSGMLLALGCCARFPSHAARERLALHIPASGRNDLRGPIAILAGSCESMTAAARKRLSPLLKKAFRVFHGTLISGGTPSGVCALAGDIGATVPDRGKLPKRVATLGYAPPGEEPDPNLARYHQQRSATGPIGLYREALGYWADILHSGVDAREVILLGIGGGPASAFEYRLALALGARVGVVAGSGLEAERLTSDERWRRTGSLLLLREEEELIGAFLGITDHWHDAEQRERMAQAIHENYLKEKQDQDPESDPALKQWSQLHENLKESNRGQADDIIRKIRLIGYRIIADGFDEGRTVDTFTDKQVEQLARAEHARWEVERGLAGWTLGKKRDNAEKISPYLVPWDELGSVQEYDRDVVRQIPELLCSAGLLLERPR